MSRGPSLVASLNIADQASRRRYESYRPGSFRVVLGSLPPLTPTLVESRLMISARVAEKLVHEHELTPDQVRTAVEGVGRLPFRWNHHAEWGTRALVTTAVDGRAVLVVLYPSGGGDAEAWCGLCLPALAPNLGG